ncbi:MAG TPA: TetR family transcriptional regulator [Blastocatellia bacterium]|nr:TetR family transcriptional regulator [Blastocatellia bacterium]
MARPKTDDPEVRAKILAAAEELFAAQGYDGTAIREIAAAAGVNGAMIHYYFGSKEGLYHAILESGAGGAHALLEKAAAGDGSSRERLTQFIEDYITFIFSRPNLPRILMRELLAGGKHLMHLSRQYPMTNYALLREIIADGKRKGELRVANPDLAPISLLGMMVVFQIFQPLVLAVTGQGRYDERFIKKLAAHTADLFLNGAANPEGAQPKKQGPNWRYW